MLDNLNLECYNKTTKYFKRRNRKMKKFLSLIVCTMMFLTSTNVFAEMVGYQPSQSKTTTYYFEGYTEPVEANGTVYYTVSNTRKSMSGELYGYLKDILCPTESVITVMQPLSGFEIGYHEIAADGSILDALPVLPDGAETYDDNSRHNIQPGTTYTLNKEGVYEIYRDSDLDCFISIISASDSELGKIVNEAEVAANPALYIPVMYEPIAAPVVPEVPEIIITEGAVLANPTDSEIVVEKGTWNMDAYNINDNNYFKLRDLAFAFTFEGASRPFEVTWDAEKNAINLISNTRYTAVGGECGGWDAELGDWSDAYWDAIMSGEKETKTQKVGVPTTSEIYIDGVKANLTAYNIDGNNYFKLRDLAQALDFEVNWDPAYNMIYVSTYGSYIPQ